MAGGTGGHVFPALAVAEELRSRGVAVNWLGTRRGIEADLVPARDFPITYIAVSGLRGMGWRTRLMAPVQLVKAFWQAIQALQTLTPDVVIGLGGFASGPGGLAARLLGRPLVIHEQNAIAGTTNRILAKIATRVLEGFPGSLPNGEYCGNPVRPEIFALPEPAARGVGAAEKPRLLVLGGSLGALFLNITLPRALALIPEGQRPRVHHQCGRKHLKVTRAAYQQAGVEADVAPFIDNMSGAYANADLVLCRAGALTVAELAAAGVGALLIPFPHAIDDHQTANGEWLVQNGAAVLVQEKDLDAKTLAQQLQDILGNRLRLELMARNARGLARPDATKAVADACLEVMP